MQNILSKIPQINKILMDDRVKRLSLENSELIVKKVIKTEVANLKNNILRGIVKEVPTFDNLIKNIENKVICENRNSLRRVINATGTILHTNLGRSILSESVKENLIDVACNYSNLEFDIENKKRGSRYNHLVNLVKILTGAEDVLVVNNNASAVVLALNTLAKEKEIVISRGELVEIGGSFRVPEIINFSGGNLVEVGTTNKTNIRDYKNAITENTGVLLKVHTSNYKIVGFTESVTNQEISKLSKENNLISINDLGSGELIDLSRYGLPYEPTVKEVLDTGIDIVTFSGDKLLGSAQAGFIVGKKEYITKMKKNPLTRMFRIDKLSLASLEATLRLYLDEERAIREVPTINMIAMSINELKEKAEEFSDMIKKLDYDVNIIESSAEVGGGSYPESYLDSIAVEVEHQDIKGVRLERLLLNEDIPIITRIKENKVIFDMRTLRKKEFSTVLESLKKISRI